MVRLLDRLCVPIMMPKIINPYKVGSANVHEVEGYIPMSVSTLVEESQNSSSPNTRIPLQNVVK